MVINYSSTYQPNGNSYLSVYGWTLNLLIEYHIVPTARPSEKRQVGCDGANYDIFTTWWYNALSISGSINTRCHFNAWKNLGMNLDSIRNCQIVASEGYQISGSSITVP
ncbi:Endo-1,4-beta-xylanase A [Leucoagaricus sp. SymC.cos]|nr:Endo-1,4-beta-xylanase A [Leucoagaricus sp. SymC.cos]